MGCGAIKGSQYVLTAGEKKAQSTWYMPDGGCVVAIHDFDPGSVHWPEKWGQPLRLKASVAIQVLRDDNSDRAYGHLVNQPEQCGYFLKHYTLPLADCLQGRKPGAFSEQHDPGSTASTTTGSATTRSSTPGWSTPASSAVGGGTATSRSSLSGFSTTAVSVARADVQPRSVSAAVPPEARWGVRRLKAADVSETGRLGSPAPPGDAYDGGSQQTGTRVMPVWETGQAPPLPRCGPGFTAPAGASGAPGSFRPATGSSVTRSSFPSVEVESLVSPRRLPASFGCEAIPATRAVPNTSGSSVVNTQMKTQGDLNLSSLSNEKFCLLKELGLQEGDGDLHWIAERAAQADLPPGWVEFYDDNGKKAFYNEKLKRVTRHHPMLARYRQFVEKSRAFRERVGEPHKKLKPHLSVFINEVMNRCHKELPAVTPELVERFSVLLNINTAVDHRLTRRVKTAIEMFVEDQYDVSIHTGMKLDIDQFLAIIREEHVKVEVLEKPEGSVMCSEIDGRAATLKCEQCLDFFSAEGFARTHVSGKRKDHTTVRCEQLVCSIYPHDLAAYEIADRFYGDRAFEELSVSDSGFRNRKRRVIGGIKCSEYAGAKADLLCEDCADFFCWEAFLELHGKGHRARHTTLTLDSRGCLHRAGQPVPPEETARIMQRARFAREGGPWLAFQDDQLTTYWYHLADKTVTSHNPYL
eukprot:TRINITY_DN102582_c0_g1_i1.p1 TRINITY_DN102582_c0_g1~~TRINITY_DN102582_c0_g1_i1.p1  ORF type:complete len:695 (+),score=93.86 TRINITY_DN102582_c0_g1_i1:94-2178(+)